MGRRNEARERPVPGPDAAMEMAARFLATRPRTRWELERRLRRGGVPDDLIGATLDRLTELGYVDDAAFARYWQEQRDRHAPRGRRMIEAELRQRGVTRETFHQLEDEPGPATSDDVLPETEPERARIALARHLRGRRLPTDRKALQRLGSFLMRRGFDAETVRGALREAGADEMTDS